MKCEHEQIPIRCIISNGSIQVRKICLNCLELTNYSFPHSDFDMEELPIKTLDEWRKLKQDDTYTLFEGL